VNGAALTLVSSSLTVAKSAGLGDQTVAVGAKQVEIGSYAFSASSAGGVNVNTVSVELTPTLDATTPAAFSNLNVFANGVKLGQTAGSVSNGTTYSFSGNFNIPAGQTVNVNVYADPLTTGPADYTPEATALVGYTGVGQTSFTSVSSNGLVNGQALHIGNGAALSLSSDQSQAATGQIVMGTTGNQLATYRFTETSNHEAASITAITVKDSAANSAFSNLYMNGVTAGPQTTVTTNSGAATTSLTVAALTGQSTTTGQSAVYMSINGSAQQVLFVPVSSTANTAAASIAQSITNLASTFHATATNPSGAVILITSALSGASGNTTSSAANVVSVQGVTGSQLAFTSSSASFAGGTNAVTTSVTNSQYYTFNFANPVSVPQGSSISLVLTGDAATYSSNGAVDDSVHSFSVSSVTAQGATSNAALLAPSGLNTTTGNPQTVLRSTLTFAPVAVGATSNRGKSTGDELADLSFTANAAGSIAVNTVNVSFSGTAASPASSTLSAAGAVQLVENNISLATGTPSSTPNGVVWKFNLGTTTAGQAVSPSATRTWKLIVNDNNLASAPAGTQGTVNLIAAINTNADITYTDGLDTNATSSLMLPSFPTPIQLNSVSFAQGI
jgi:hypothetical protein